MNKELLCELFDYKNGELYWKSNRGKVKAGSIAGRLATGTYKQVKINYQSYLNHRLIFLMHHGYMPDYVDHINGNKTDNRIENLREATKNQNQHNRKISTNSKSGVKGVFWHKRDKKWQVHIGTDSKLKYFGSFTDLELAKLVATEARNKYHGEYANHG